MTPAVVGTVAGVIGIVAAPGRVASRADHQPDPRHHRRCRSSSSPATPVRSPSPSSPWPASPGSSSARSPPTGAAVIHTRSRSRSRRSLAALGAMVVGRPRRPARAAHPRPPGRGGHPRARRRHRSAVVPQPGLRRHERARTSRAPSCSGSTSARVVGADFPRLQFGLLVLAVLVGVAIAVAKLRKSSLGSAMLAVRANERSAAGAGIDVVRVKFAAPSPSPRSSPGSAARCSPTSRATSPSTPSRRFVGLVLFATVYIGGITSVSGGIVAGLLAAGGLMAADLRQALRPGRLVRGHQPRSASVHRHQEPRRHRRADPRPGSAKRRAPGRPGHRQARPAGERRRGWLAHGRRSRVATSCSPTRDLRVTYGGMVAVDGVDLEVRRGTIVGLIGPNGAGKTTLLDAMSGFTPYTGSVVLDGRDLARPRPSPPGSGRAGAHVPAHPAVRRPVGDRERRGRSTPRLTIARPRSVEETLELLGLGPRTPTARSASSPRVAASSCRSPGP